GRSQPHLHLLGGHEGPVPTQAPVHRARDQGVRALGVVRELPGGHGRAAGRHDARTDRQRRRLRARQLPVGDASRAVAQQTSAFRMEAANHERNDTMIPCTSGTVAVYVANGRENHVPVEAWSDDGTTGYVANDVPEDAVRTALVPAHTLSGLGTFAGY